MKKPASLAVIIAACLWGLDLVVLRPSFINLTVSIVVFIESSIAALIFTLIFCKQLHELKNLYAKDWLIFAGVALFGGSIGAMAITKASFYVNFVNLSIVALIQKLQPVFAIILASLFLREKLTKKFISWALLALIGTYFMTFGLALPNLNTDHKTIMAALFALLSAFSFGFSTVLSKRSLKNISFQLGTTVRFLLTSVILLVVSLCLGDLHVINEITQKQALIFILIAFTTGGTAIFLYYYGLKKMPASMATIYELSFPLTVIILEYALRDNLLDKYQWIGVAVLLVSIIKVSRLNLQTVN